jgi:hypothetical protein
MHDDPVMIRDHCEDGKQFRESRFLQMRFVVRISESAPW